MSKNIEVKSEIGKLNSVLLHRPGKELEQLEPDLLAELLFDDIPYLEAAQAEHDAFAKALTENGVEVLYLTELAKEALHSDEIKSLFIDDLIQQSGALPRHYKNEIKAYLSEFNESDLVKKAIAGVTLADFSPGRKGKLVSNLPSDMKSVIHPMPNLYFTRDPFATIGNKVSLSRMKYPTRHRETIFSRYIFNYHPDFKHIKPYYTNDLPYFLEGGDILCLGETVIAVGLSQRTKAESIEILANNIFSDEESTIQTILVFEIPPVRAYMHLDTVFTQVDFDKFTIYAGIQQAINPYILTKTFDKSLYKVELSKDSLEDILKKYLGINQVKFISCGGLNSVAAAREQWNDGANTLAISPGKVVCYNRNSITNDILRQEGIEVVEVPSSELSRGRGGPRCMSMPLNRTQI